MLDIIKSIYSVVKSQVKHNNTLSDIFFSSIGVRQGECLSPFLFSIYLNDLEAELETKGMEGLDIGTLKLFILLYADDIVLFGNSADELQKSIKILEEYCQMWKLTVNTSKTKVIIFRNGGRLPNGLKLTYKGTEIEIVSKFSYLGIVFTVGGSCKETQRTLAGQASKAIFALNKYLYKFTFIKPSHILELFDKLISPILNYGSEVWGFNKAPAIETVHLHFCKKLLGVKQSTQNDFIYGERGRLNFQVQRYISIVRYWLKIVTLDENKYVKCIYNMMIQDLESSPEKPNWALHVKHLLSIYGFRNVWEAQYIENSKSFLEIFKQKVKDCIVQEWHSRVEDSLKDSNRARTFIHITNFKAQPYLDKITVKKFQTSLSRLRLSSHRLHVETGRWKKPVKTPFNERKCAICNLLEDEFHFVLECSIYKELRKQYIAKYYWIRPNMMKFIELCTSDRKKTIRKLGIFVEKAFSLRKEVMSGINM